MRRDLVLQLDVPSSPEYIAIVRLVVAAVASARRALADERVDDLKLAVSEACTNAIEANRSIRPGAPVHIEVWEEPDRLEVSIDDRGPGFDLEKLAFPPPITDPERLNFERGLGIPLIKTLVDNVVFVRLEKGTSVRLTVFGGPLGEDDTGAIYLDASKLAAPTTPQLAAPTTPQLAAPIKPQLAAPIKPQVAAPGERQVAGTGAPPSATNWPNRPDAPAQQA
jgi:serine/threonine-protein kinase RsbW